MSLHPRQTKMRLQERDNAGSFLLVHYNPTEWTDNKEVEYEDVEVSGRGTQTAQFKMGKPREIQLALFLNEWGQNHPTQMGVEEAIAWLRDKQVPKAAGDNEPAPPIMQLVWREVFACVITAVNVTRLMMRPASAAGGGRKEFDAIRANVDVTLREFVESTE
jgi:hypothetical protein